MTNNQKLIAKEAKIDYSTMDTLAIALAQEKVKEAPTCFAFNSELAAQPKDNAATASPEKSAHESKLISKGFYIEQRQFKAIKLLAATSDRVEDKDYSAIIRAAIDLYLANRGAV